MMSDESMQSGSESELFRPFSDEAKNRLKEHAPTQELQAWLKTLDREYVSTLLEVAMERRMVFLTVVEKDQRDVSLMTLALAAAMVLAPIAKRLNLQPGQIKADFDRIEAGAAQAFTMLKESVGLDKVFQQ